MAIDCLDVLVIGGGCSGSLVAAHLREGLEEQRSDAVPQVRLHVWEWARGPAGRMTTFWAEVDGERHVADVGAQVLSVRDTATACRLVELGAIDAEGLAPSTCERPSGNQWQHFWAPGGLTDVLRRQLENSMPEELAFNRRVFSIWREGNQLGVEGRADGPHGRVVSKFDAVILAVTAKDALAIDGVSTLLGKEMAEGLGKVKYDHRLCMAIMLPASFRKRLWTLFGPSAAELDFENEGGVLGLLAWQDRKRRQHGARVVVVAHSTREFAARNLHQAKTLGRHPRELGADGILAAVAEKLTLESEEFAAAVLDSKVVHWRQCQLQRGVPGHGPCLVAMPEGTPGPLLTVCGDYLSGQANFDGCNHSALTAARTVLDWVSKRSHRASASRANATLHAAKGSTARRWVSEAHQGCETGKVVAVPPMVSAPKGARRWQKKSTADNDW